MHCAFFPDGKSLLVGEWSGGKYALCRIDSQTGAEISTFASKDFASAVRVAPDSRSVARLVRGVLEVYDAATGRLRWSAKIPEWSSALAFAPDSAVLATGGRDAVVRLWDTATGRPIQEWAGHNGEVTSLAFSADGRRLVSAGGNICLVWDCHNLGARPKRP